MLTPEILAQGFRRLLFLALATKLPINYLQIKFIDPS